MIGPIQESVTFGSPAAPANNATVSLFDSTVAFGAGVMRALNLTSLDFNFVLLDQASAANGFKIYTSDNGGTDWYQLSYPDSTPAATMPKTIAAVAADSNTLETFDVTPLNEVKVTFTAGATGPTSGSGWKVVVRGTLNGAAVQR